MLSAQASELSEHTQSILERLCRQALGKPEGDRLELPFFTGEEDSYRQLEFCGYITSVPGKDREFDKIHPTDKFTRLCTSYSRKRTQ